jgi:hypothetical protein
MSKVLAMASLIGVLGWIFGGLFVSALPFPHELRNFANLLSLFLGAVVGAIAGATSAIIEAMNQRGTTDKGSSRE